MHITIQDKIQQRKGKQTNKQTDTLPSRQRSGFVSKKTKETKLTDKLYTRGYACSESADDHVHKREEGGGGDEEKEKRKEREKINKRI